MILARECVQPNCIGESPMSVILAYTVIMLYKNSKVVTDIISVVGGVNG